MFDLDQKPEPWGFDPGLVSRDFDWFHDAVVGIWPMWEAAGVELQDLSGNGNHGAYTVAGGDGGFATEINGPVTTYVGDDDFINLNVENLEDVDLFCDSGSPDFSVIWRFRGGSGEDGTLIAKGSSDINTRQFQAGLSSEQTPTLFYNIRGTITGFDIPGVDQNYHII